MQSPEALLLAGDILESQFGGTVARVAQLLLTRGPLTVQQVLCLANERCRLPTERLEFPVCRNALLTLLRHNIATADSLEEKGSQFADARFQYSVSVLNVFGRSRFALFMEHVRCMYGALAEHLVLLAFAHGCASGGCLVAEARKKYPEHSHQETLDVLLELVREGMLWTKTRLWEEEQDTRSDAAKSVVAEELNRRGKQRRTDNSTSSSDLEQVFVDQVYTFNRAQLEFCLIQNFLGQRISQRIGAKVSRVIFALLPSVRFSTSTGEITEAPMTAGELDARLQRMLAAAPGHALDNSRKVVDGVLKLLSPEFIRPVGDAHDPDQSEPVQKYVIAWEQGMRELRDFVLSSLVRQKFGVLGFRIWNLLTEDQPPRRMEDRHISQECLLEPETCRTILHAMVSANFIQQTQELSSSEPEDATWLFYVDYYRAETAAVRLVIRSILNMRKRRQAEAQEVAVQGTAADKRKDRTWEQQMDALELCALQLDIWLLLLSCT